jgi:hypothetical protein
MFAEAATRAGASEFSPDSTLGALPAVLIYCPHQRMQAKEVAACVELESGRVLPLNRQAHEQSLAEEIHLLNESYRRLWRLYLFVHPNLLAHGNEGELPYAMALSGLIDAFCDRFGIPLDARKRGSRFRYLPLRQRVEPILDRFMGRIRNAPRERILELATGDDVHQDFWRNALGDNALHYPITEDECLNGFALACFVCAAQDVGDRVREGWPEQLRGHDANQLVRPGRTDIEESVRRKAIQGLHSASLNLVSANAQRQRPTDWNSLVTTAGRVVTAK